MLVIRKEQMRAFQGALDERRVKKLVIEVSRRLLTQGIIGEAAEQAHHGSGEKPQGGGDAEKDQSSGVRERIEVDVRRGLRFGIRSETGLVQFVSYGFTFMPSWHENADVRTILANPELPEADKLEGVHRILARV